MVLTVKQAIAEIRHELGGRTDARLPELEIINRAGEHLTQCRQWKFLKRGPIDLKIEANRSTVDLPPDAAGEVMMSVTGSSFSGAIQSTIEQIMEERAVSSMPYGTLLYATTYVDPYSGSSEPRPTLVVHPSQTTELDISITYRAGWVALTNALETAVIAGKGGQFPDWAAALYVEFMRAFAAGYERSTGGSISARLAEIQGGPVYAAAVRRDIKTHRTVGVMASMPSREQSWENGDALPPG